MKATLLLGAILLISLVMANDQGKPEENKKSESNPPESKPSESPSKTTPKAPSTGIMMSGGPVFFLLPLMWLVVHLLHI